MILIYLILLLDDKNGTTFKEQNVNSIKVLLKLYNIFYFTFYPILPLLYDNHSTDKSHPFEILIRSRKNFL